MYTSSAFGLMGAKAVDRDVLLVPEALVEDLGARTEDIARPLIDAVWNATGYAKSPNFDEKGEWKPR